MMLSERWPWTSAVPPNAVPPVMARLSDPITRSVKGGVETVGVFGLCEL